MRHTLSVITLALISAVACAQAELITIAEANTVLNKVDAAISRTLGTKNTVKLTAIDKKPASRGAIIAALGEMFAAYEPQFQYTPRRLTLDSKTIEKCNPLQSTRDSLTRLVKFGCAGTVSPLVVGPGDTMTAADFADAVSYFAAQIAALTYFADPAWIPNLQRTNEKDG